MKENSNKNLPDIIYNDLIELFGKDKACEIIEQHGNNFRYLNYLILDEHTKRRIGLNLKQCLILVLAVFITLAFVFN